MLFSDLALILTIMINTIILHQSSEAAIITGKGHPNFYPQGVLKQNKIIKMRQKKWYLDPVMSKLDIAVDKYDRNRGLIETIYSGVIGCGVNKCGRIKRLIPENQTMGHVKCFRDNFKKRISKKLLKFHKGVRIIEKTFRDLIYFEESSTFNNRSRKTLLKELRIDLIELNLETETVMVNKRLNFSQEPKTSTWTRIPYPDYETHLIINEWRIIQDSKRFLQDWQGNFEKIFKCWKKRRRRRRKRLQAGNSKQPVKPPHSHPKILETLFSRATE